YLRIVVSFCLVALLSSTLFPYTTLFRSLLHTRFLCRLRESLELPEDQDEACCAGGCLACLYPLSEHKSAEAVHPLKSGGRVEFVSELAPQRAFSRYPRSGVR